MNNIQVLRKAAGLTQSALADAAGMNIRQIQKLESGEIQIDNITLRNGLRLADALGVNPYDLITIDRSR